MKKYEKYKYSGINWIGNVPESWSILPMKRGMNICNGKDYKTVQSENGYPVIGSGGQFAFASDYLYDGEAVLLGRKGTVDKPMYINGRFWTVDTMFYAVPKENVFCKYMYYQSLTIPFARYSTNTALPSMTQSDLNSNPMCFPSIEEQQMIAYFLDYKTEKIDRLVSLLSDRIEDLKKYRQAIISEAVTHGLDKSAKMKDSGVEWIGEIPESWSIIRLRFLGASQNGISKSKEFFGQGYPFVSYSDVYKNESLPQNPSGLVLSTEEERKNFSVKEGDVFFTRTSETAEEIGFSSVCEKTIENATFAGFLIRFRPNPGVLNKGFSKYFFRSDIHRWYFVNKMNIVTRASLSQDILMSMPVVLPPLSDQQAIADYLDRKTKQIDDCIAATEQRIEDLQKYRTSLIYEAVTGQIDVRDWA